MAVNFTNSPSDAATITADGRTYTFSSSTGKWDVTSSPGDTLLSLTDVGSDGTNGQVLTTNGSGSFTFTTVSSGGGASVSTSDTAPSSPSSGDLWFDTTELTPYIYYADGSSNQWIEFANPDVGGASSDSSGGGVTTYANIAALPSSGNTGGDLAFVTDVKAVYVWDGTEWDRVSSGQNMLPEFTTSPAASYNLASDGTATTVTVAATDPEGFAVTYSHDTSPSNQAQATITQSGGTFTITPSTTQSNAGDFTARFKAFDGVRTNSASSTFSLEFASPNTLVSGLIGWWDFGKSSSYSGSGTTWSDISPNSNDMTISGGTYVASSTQHSVPTMYFDVSGSNFVFPSNIRSNAKTYIFIFYPLSTNNFIMMGDGTTARYSFFFLNGNTSAGAFQSPSYATWSGETKRHYINGSTYKTTRDAAFDALDFTKYNMAAVTGLNATANTYRMDGLH